MTSYGFYVDTQSCIKCWSCEVACKQWNGIAAGTYARRKVLEFVEGKFPSVRRRFASVACMHCVNPACAESCSTGAITQREDGIVVIDKEKCTGCGACEQACPYGVPQMVDGAADKCDCCIGNGVEPGYQPHCVSSCPTQALKFGSFDDAAEKEAYIALFATLNSDSPDESFFSSEPPASFVEAEAEPFEGDVRSAAQNSGSSEGDEGASAASC